MAGIDYTYDAATQDLWLYQDETLVHTGGSTVVKKPIAWNPNSPLYGYRASLQGISLRRRYPTTPLSTVSPAQYATLSAFNDPLNPANTYAFNNVYPMGVYAVSKKLLWCCGHCFGMLSRVRNPAQFWSGTVFTANSFNDRMMNFSWMNKDNVVTDSFDTTQVIAPYDSDTTPLLFESSDLTITELPSELSFDPLTVVDIRTLVEGANMWVLDSAMKIMRCKFNRASIFMGSDKYSARLKKWDGVTASSSVFYLHDSGSVILAEISPPTSAAAGDGVMGLVPYHMVGAGDVFNGAGTSGYGEFTSPGTYAAAATPEHRIRDYMSDRGSPMPAAEQAKRQHASGDFALVPVMDRSLEAVQALHT